MEVESTSIERSLSGRLGRTSSNVSGTGSVSGSASASQRLRGPAEEAHQSAEQLFEQRPVEEIRGVGERAKRQVDLKREELRQVIGASYREFIDSADGIKAMSEASVSAAKDLDEIKSKIFALGKQLGKNIGKREKGAEEGARNGGRGERGSGDDLPLSTRLYALGSRAKILLDTSESMWAVLEAEKSNQQKSLLESSAQDAEGVSTRILSHGARLAARAFVLWQTQGEEVSKKFPLLAKQKVQLLELCRRLRTACLTRLEASHLDRSLTIDALAAVVLLDIVYASLRESSKGKDNQAFVQDDNIKSGLSLCSLWLKQRLAAVPKAANSWESLSKIGEIVRDVLCEVESLFVASKQYAKSNLSALCLPDVEGDIWYEALPRHEDELKLWRQYLDGFVQTTSPISLKMVSELCSKWIKSIQKESEKLGNEHIGVLSGLPQLMEAEKRIHSTLSGQEEADGKKYPELSHGSASKDFEEHCLSILHRQIHVWKDFYEVSFADQAKIIIEKEFSEIVPIVKSEVRKVDPQTLSAAATELDLEYRNKLCRILNTLRVNVGKIFIETVEFMLLPCDSSLLESRISMLQGFLQECCFKLLEKIGEHLELAMSEENVCPSYGVFLSNLCDCLQTENSELFQFIFGKPKEWISRGGTNTSSKRDIHATQMYSLDMDEVQNKLAGMVGDGAMTSAQLALSSLDFAKRVDVEGKLGKLSLSAYELFAKSVAKSVGEAVEENLSLDGAATNWEEISIKDTEGNSISFSLPHTPSAFVMDQLFSALSAGHKARLFGKTNLSNLKLFKASITTAYIRAFTKFLDAHGEGLTEGLVLQLLFDVRFLSEVMASGGNAGVDGSTRLEQRLEQSLDPIDWATYEPYLWKNVGRFVQRCCLLFGDFMDQRKQDKEMKTKSSSQSNILPTSENVPRFNLLPISSPKLFDIGVYIDTEVAAQKPAEKGSKDKKAEDQKSNIFGSILGEKAAEASAMAQDLFSGAGFFTSLTSNK